MSSASMQAAVLTRFGAPLELQEMPRPRAGQPDDVIVKIAGAGICGTDVHLWKGEWRDAPGHHAALPLILGHENAGRIEDPGEFGLRSGYRRGDPVLVHPMNSCGLCPACRHGDDMQCAAGREPGIHGLHGGFAGYLKTKVRCLLALPPDTDPAPLAPLADAGLTAYHAVKRVAGALGPGSVAVVVGVGGLGSFGVQLLARLTQARIIAVDLAAERLMHAQELGASDVMLAEQGMFADDLLTVLGDQVVNVALDFVGSEQSAAECLRVIARSGIYSVIGYGGVVAADTRELIQRELTIQGNLAGSYEDLVALARLHLRSPLRVRSKCVPLAQAAAAFAAVAAGTVAERVILVPHAEDNRG
jgi:D-arabinose 1-dehydrogenase-like Zn-dependent alcohol dehydrogenase